MVMLKADECRVLGVLVEKAQTTPAQYPMTLNGIVVGCNQKNNRYPVVEWDEDRVMAALDGLRGKGLVREAMLSGSRVAKFRHLGREVYGIDTGELVVLTELLLRGPQSIGEIRGRASRMHDLGSLEAVQGIVDGLRARKSADGGAGEAREALVKEYPAPAGSRAKLYGQILCPDLHAIEARGDGGAEREAGEEFGGGVTGDELVSRVEALEVEVKRLREMVEELGGR